MALSRYPYAIRTAMVNYLFKHVLTIDNSTFHGELAPSPQKDQADTSEKSGLGYVPGGWMYFPDLNFGCSRLSGTTLALLS